MSRCWLRAAARRKSRTGDAGPDAAARNDGAAGRAEGGPAARRPVIRCGDRRRATSTPALGKAVRRLRDAGLRRQQSEADTDLPVGRMAGLRHLRRDPELRRHRRRLHRHRLRLRRARSWLRLVRRRPAVRLRARPGHGRHDGLHRAVRRPAPVSQPPAATERSRGPRSATTETPSPATGARPTASCRR